MLRGWRGLEGPVVQFQKGVFDVVADGVEGEVVWGEAEGIFELVGDGFQGHVGIGDKGDENGHEPAEAVDQAQRKKEAIDVDGAMEEDAIAIGNGCAGDAFAAADDIGKLVEVVVEGPLGDGVDGAAVFGGLDNLAELLDEEDGFIAGCFCADGEGGWEEAVDVLARIGLAELMFKGIGQGDEVVDELSGLFYVPGFIVEGEGFAGQGTAGIGECAPEPAGFREAFVAGAVAEAEEKCHGDAEEGKRGWAEVEVVKDDVFPEPGYNDGDDQQEAEAADELWQDGAVPDKQHFEPVLFFSDDHGLKFGDF